MSYLVANPEDRFFSRRGSSALPKLFPLLPENRSPTHNRSVVKKLFTCVILLKYILIQLTTTTTKKKSPCGVMLFFRLFSLLLYIHNCKPKEKTDYVFYSHFECFFFCFFFIIRCMLVNSIFFHETLPAVS